MSAGNHTLSATAGASSMLRDSPSKALATLLLCPHRSRTTGGKKSDRRDLLLPTEIDAVRVTDTVRPRLRRRRKLCGEA